MNKPIEQGCRAIICKGVYTGLHVVVGKYLGYVPLHETPRQWEINKPVTNNLGEAVYHKGEEYLKRVDGQDTTTWQHVKETCLWSPDRVKEAG